MTKDKRNTNTINTGFARNGRHVIIKDPKVRSVMVSVWSKFPWRDHQLLICKADRASNCRCHFLWCRAQSPLSQWALQAHHLGEVIFGTICFYMFLKSSCVVFLTHFWNNEVTVFILRFCRDSDNLFCWSLWHSHSVASLRTEQTEICRVYFRIVLKIILVCSGYLRLV